MDIEYPDLVRCCGGRITPESIEQFQHAMIEYEKFVNGMCCSRRAERLCELFHTAFHVRTRPSSPLIAPGTNPSRLRSDLHAVPAASHKT